MYQLTTPTTLPSARRNAMVVEANIPCTANDCERQATRWSNLCGLCERQWLEDHRPVWGKPTKEQLAAAQAVVRVHYREQIKSGVFDDWSAQIGKRLARPVSLLISPLALKRYRYPRQRFTPLLALRTRDRGVLTRRGVINLLAFCSGRGHADHSYHPSASEEGIHACLARPTLHGQRGLQQDGDPLSQPT